MHLNHLGLPVRGPRRSQQFYSAYFGFDSAGARACAGAAAASAETAAELLGSAQAASLQASLCGRSG
jgi:hypothetical protein